MCCFVIAEIWGAVSTVSLPATAGQVGITSMSSAWHSPAHNHPNNSNSMVDNEFDMLGTRSRSPMMMSSTAYAAPTHSQLSAGM